MVSLTAIKLSCDDIEVGDGSEFSDWSVTDDDEDDGEIMTCSEIRLGFFLHKI